MNKKIVLKGNLNGVEFKKYLNIASLPKCVEVVEFNKHLNEMVRMDKNGNPIILTANEYYEDLLKRGIVINLKNYYMVLEGSKNDKIIEEITKKELKKYKEYMGGVLYDYVKEIKYFNMCKSFIEEIKKKSAFSEVFKKRLIENTKNGFMEEITI